MARMETNYAMDFLKKVSGCQLFKGSSLAQKSWKFYNIFAAL